MLALRAVAVVFTCNTPGHEASRFSLQMRQPRLKEVTCLPKVPWLVCDAVTPGLSVHLPYTLSGWVLPPLRYFSAQLLTLRLNLTFNKEPFRLRGAPRETAAELSPSLVPGDAAREENEESEFDFYSLLKNRSTDSNESICNPPSS